MTEAAEATRTVTCRKCHDTYVPNFIKDFYPDSKDNPEIGLCEGCMMREAFAPKAPMAIDPDKVSTVCGLGSGKATCSFLVLSGQFECAKGTSLERSIRLRREAGTMGAMGDNCQGPPGYKPLQA